MLRLRVVAGVLTALPLLLSCGAGESESPPVATSLAATSPMSVQATAGASVSEKPTVVVKDQRGNPMGNVSVTFAVSGGSGTVTGPTQVTTAAGVAMLGDWTLGTVAGVNTVTASTGSLAPVTFTATGVPGPATIFEKVAGDGQTAIAGSSVSISPAVKVADANGNGVSGVTVNFSVSTGGGSPSSVAVVSNAAGVAALSAWTLGTVAGTNSISATAGALPPLLFTATGVAGPPAQLVVVTQPSSAVSNVALSPNPVVEVRDANGNLVTTATTSITCAVGTGSGSMGGTITVNAVAGIATFSNLFITGITSDGTAALRFSASGLTSATSANMAVALVAQNLSIDGVYLTQSTQNFGGSVPLVASRAALLRVFVKADKTNTLTPTVKVRLYRAGSLVENYSIDAPTGAVPSNSNEGVLNSSWNVVIPGSVVQPGLAILVVVDPTGSVAETDKADNSYPVSGVPKVLDVRSPPTFNARLVPVMQLPNGLQGDVTDANKDTYMDFAWRVYPFSRYDVDVHAPFSYSASLSSTYDATWSNLLSQINALRVGEGSSRFYYGVIKPAYSGGGTGLGYLGVPAAIGIDWLNPVSPETTLRAMTAAHEWGHNFNRFHVNCGGPTGTDPLYPYVTSSIGVYGYDIELGALRSTELADLMSYCRPLWISDYTYRAVLDFRASGTAVTSANVAQRSLLVWGRIGPDGMVLEPSFEIDAIPSMPTRSGRYSLRATDDAGREVFNFSFDGLQLDHMSSERHFAFVVPLGSTAKPAQLRLAGSGRELFQRRSLALRAGGDETPTTATQTRTSRGVRVKIKWDAVAYPMALVRNPSTGEILSFARGGLTEIAFADRRIEVTLSDGVGSARQMVPVR